jgi:WD40 repeat protein
LLYCTKTVLPEVTMKTIACAWALALTLTFSMPAYAASATLALKYKIDVEGLLGQWTNLLAFSPDGGMIAEGSNTGPPSESETDSLILWSFPDGKPLRRFKYRPLALSADWKYLATEDAIVDMTAGKAVLSLGERFGKLACAKFSPDDQYLAFTTDQPVAFVAHQQVLSGKPRIQVVHTHDGRVLREFGKRYVSALAFSPTGTVLASGHWDNVTIWNVDTGQRAALLRGFGRYVYGIAFSGDGNLLAAGTNEGELQIWDVPNRRHLHSISLGGLDVSAPAFSPGGKLIAAGTYGNGTLSLVDVASGELLSQVRTSEFGCGSVAFSPDGRYLIAPSTGGPIGRRQLATGGSIRVFEVHDP